MVERGIAIGNRLKAVCKEKNMTYAELSEKSGMPVRRIYRISYGQHSNPGVFTMMQLCDGLGITLDEFFDTDELKEFRK